MVCYISGYFNTILYLVFYILSAKMRIIITIPISGAKRKLYHPELELTLFYSVLISYEKEKLRYKMQQRYSCCYGSEQYAGFNDITEN